MTEIRIKKQIAARVEDVFTRATDFAGAADAITGIDKVEMLTDGPVGIGTRFRETRTFMKKEATEVMEITAFEPPHRYVLDAESHGCHYVSEFTLSPTGDGTEIEMRFEAQPLTTMAKIMSFLTKPMANKMKDMCAKDLDDLKHTIERSART